MLADGIVRQTLMRSYLASFHIKDRPRLRSLGANTRAVALNKAPIIVGSNKANLLAFSLGSYRQSSIRRNLAHLWLGQLAQRETGMCKLLLIQHMQNIRLIFVRVEALEQSPPAGHRIGLHPHVMSRCQVVRTER